MILKKIGPQGLICPHHGAIYMYMYITIIVRHRNLEYQPKSAIPSIENVFAFFERGYIVHFKTK